MGKKDEKKEKEKVYERKGKITALGVSVNKDDSMMLAEVNGIRIDFPKDKEVTIKVER